MSSFSSSLIQEHPEKRGWRHLWELRLNPSEYDSLKKSIQDRCEYFENNPTCQVTKVFDGVERDVTLYFAEWWRREYSGGHVSIDNICKGLFKNIGLRKAIYNAALDGARLMQLQIVRTQGEDRERDNALYSILYQGGLPMNYIVKDIKASVGSSRWNRFFRALVWDEQDYSELPGNGIIASHSKSIKAFCEKLQSAATIMDTPFSPQGSKDWWDVIQQEFETEKNERKKRDPFSFKWLVLVNENRRELTAQFHLSAPRELPEEFIDAHGMKGAELVSLTIFIEGTPYPLAEYNRSNGKLYSRRSIDKKFNYRFGDQIEIVLNKTGNDNVILSTRYLDFSDPKLLCLSDPRINCYCPCDSKKIADEKCIIISTTDWICDKIAHEDFTCNDDHFCLFKVNGDSVPIELYSPETGKKKTFDPEISLSWTVIDENCAVVLSVPTKEKIYNSLKGIQFYEDYGDRREKCITFYEGHGSKGDKPGFGMIKASVQKSDGSSVDPVRFINVGNLDCKCIKSTSEMCDLQIIWPHGKVESDYADCLDDNIWHIEKKLLKDPRYAPFIFKPYNERGYCFTLSFKVPFYGFHVFDCNGKEVNNGATIPAVDLDSYRYYLRLPEKLEITPGVKTKNDGVTFSYSSSDSGKGVKVTEHLAELYREGMIPNEGSLASLFMDGTEQLASMFEKQTEPLPKAEVRLTASYNGGRKSLVFKDFPYRLDYSDGVVSVRETRGLPNYTYGLLAIPFDDPTQPAIALEKLDNESGKYIVPETIFNSKYEKWLVYGNIKGYVLPMALFTKDENLAEDERRASRKETLAYLKSALSSDPLFSKKWIGAIKWLDLTQDGIIPGTSILELVAISDDRELLGKIALQAYILYDPDKALFTLKDFSRQLSFLWKWAGISAAKSWLESIVDKEFLDHIKPYYVNWVLVNRPQEDWGLWLADDSKISECYRSYLIEFQNWFAQLCKEPEKKIIHADIRQNGGDERLSEDAQAVFNSVVEMIANEKGIKREDLIRRYTPDDLWKLERRKLSDLFLQMNLGDIAEEEDVRFEIRKSILYGLKFKLSVEEQI